MRRKGGGDKAAASCDAQIQPDWIPCVPSVSRARLSAQVQQMWVPDLRVSWPLAPRLHAVELFRFRRALMPRRLLAMAGWLAAASGEDHSTKGGRLQQYLYDVSERQRCEKL
jgi:hypothetical protein